MDKVDNFPKRRTVLAGGLMLCTAPLLGCTTPGSRRPENLERMKFMSSAMDDLKDEARKQSEAQQGRGAAAAMSLSSVSVVGNAVRMVPAPRTLRSGAMSRNTSAAPVGCSMAKRPSAGIAAYSEAGLSGRRQAVATDTAAKTPTEA